jgi:hypothetical protein
VIVSALLWLALASGPGASGLAEIVSHLPRCGESCWQQDARGGMSLLPELERLREKLDHGSVLDRDDWETILIDKGYLQWRDPWPSSEPFAVSFHLPALYQGISVELIPRRKELRSARASHWEMMCALYESSRRDAESYQELGMLSPGRQTIELDVRVTTPQWHINSRDSKIHDRADVVGPISFEVQVSDSFDAAFPPDDDSAIALALSAGLRLVRDDGFPRYAIRLSVPRARVPAGVALAIDLVVMRDGKEISRRSASGSQLADSVELGWIASRALEDPERASHWTIEISGNRRGALMDPKATRRWSGAVRVPVSDIPRE